MILAGALILYTVFVGLFLVVVMDKEDRDWIDGEDDWDNIGDDDEEWFE